MNFFVLLLRDT